MKFYFTYGADSKFPYQGGWTEVRAENWTLAHLGFTTFHPNRKNSKLLNCAGMYSEAEWARTEMARKNDNLGHARRDKITVSVNRHFVMGAGNRYAVVNTISIIQDVTDGG